jgi:hypothetical protein
MKTSWFPGILKDREAERPAGHPSGSENILIFDETGGAALV